jgi:hypothetical protein
LSACNVALGVWPSGMVAVSWRKPVASTAKVWLRSRDGGQPAHGKAGVAVILAQFAEAARHRSPDRARRRRREGQCGYGKDCRKGNRPGEREPRSDPQPWRALRPARPTQRPRSNEACCHGEGQQDERRPGRSGKDALPFWHELARTRFNRLFSVLRTHAPYLTEVILGATIAERPMRAYASITVRRRVGPWPAPSSYIWSCGTKVKWCERSCVFHIGLSQRWIVDRGPCLPMLYQCVRVSRSTMEYHIEV